MVCRDRFEDVSLVSSLRIFVETFVPCCWFSILRSPKPDISKKSLLIAMPFPLTTRVLNLLAAASVVAAANIPQTLIRDVVIIGGGASGVHAAIRLRDDFHKSIALIEKQEILV